MRTPDGNSGRWPPVYDAEDLKREIRKLAERHDVSNVFYESATLDYPCQGDIIRVNAGIPLLDKNGTSRVAPHPLGVWMIVGNTCDFGRDLTDSTWTQIVPVVDLLQGTRPHNEASLRRYETARMFFLPPWSAEEQERLFVANFTRPVQIHKEAFLGGAVQTLATMQRASWILLNACLVRFLARDDGRFESD